MASLCIGTMYHVGQTQGQLVNVTCFLRDDNVDWRRSSPKYPGKIFTDDVKYIAKQNYLAIRNFSIDDEDIYLCYPRTGGPALLKFNITIEGNFL